MDVEKRAEGPVLDRFLHEPGVQTLSEGQLRAARLLPSCTPSAEIDTGQLAIWVWRHTHMCATPEAFVTTDAVCAGTFTTTPAGWLAQKLTGQLKFTVTVEPAIGLLARSRTVTSKQQVPSGPA